MANLSMYLEDVVFEGEQVDKYVRDKLAAKKEEKQKARDRMSRRMEAPNNHGGYYPPSHSDSEEVDRARGGLYDKKPKNKHTGADYEATDKLYKHRYEKKRYEEKKAKAAENRAKYNQKGVSDDEVNAYKNKYLKKESAIYNPDLV